MYFSYLHLFHTQGWMEHFFLCSHTHCTHKSVYKYFLPNTFILYTIHKHWLPSIWTHPKHFLLNVIWYMYMYVNIKFLLSILAWVFLLMMHERGKFLNPVFDLYFLGTGSKYLKQVFNYFKLTFTCICMQEIFMRFTRFWHCKYISPRTSPQCLWYFIFQIICYVIAE